MRTRRGIYLLSFVDLTAIGCQWASAAIRIPGSAAVSSKQNDPMAKIAGFFGGENFAQLLLHLFRIFSLRKP